MHRHLGRFATAAAIAAFCLMATYWFERPAGRLLAQASPGRGESMPGPIIVDPPAPYRGSSYVPAPKADLLTPRSALSNFIVTYNGFPPQAQVAFQAAVDIWATQVQSPVPIRVDAYWEVLDAGVLGSAGATTVHRDFAGAPVAATWYPAAIANRLFGSDLDPAQAEIEASFNSDFDWYFGTDGNAGVKYDLMSVVLHELGHGLGFFGSMDGTGGVGSWGYGSGFPFIYDRFNINLSSQFLLDTALFPNPSVALFNQLIGNAVYFNGANARNGNGGNAARLYAPASWVPGSSIAHLSEVTFPAGNPNSLMTPQLAAGEVIHDPGPIVRGSFLDMGYAIGSQAGDYSGDHFSDILWRNTSGAAAIYLMNGTTVIGGGGFTTVDPAWVISGNGDYNGDGRADILWRNTSGAAAIYLMNGTTVIGGGGFTTVDPLWAIVGSGDHNGDGRADILWRNTSTGGAAIWFMNGTAVIGGGGFTTVDPAWLIVGSGDYNADGKADILWRNTSGAAAIWFMNGTTTIGGGGFTTVDPSWKIVGTADYNGDSRSDILWRNTSGAAAIWFMNGTTTIGGGGFATVDPSWKIVGTGDYNGDAKADILWRNTSGATTIWFMNGTTTIGGGGIGTIDPSWQVMPLAGQP